MLNHTKLTLPERKLLAVWKPAGLSVRECARRLNRHPSTVSRELKRNLFVGQEVRVYEPLYAQGKFEFRKAKAWTAKHPLKNSLVFAYVIEKLEAGWSPEQISGRLKHVDHPHQPDWQITPKPSTVSFTIPGKKTNVGGNTCGGSKNAEGLNMAVSHSAAEFPTEYPFT